MPLGHLALDTIGDLLDGLHVAVLGKLHELVGNALDGLDVVLVGLLQRCEEGVGEELRALRLAAGIAALPRCEGHGLFSVPNAKTRRGFPGGRKSRLW